MAGQGWKGLRALVKTHVTIPRRHSPLHMDDTLPRDIKKITLHTYINKLQKFENFIDRKKNHHLTVRHYTYKYLIKLKKFILKACFNQCSLNLKLMY